MSDEEGAVSWRMMFVGCLWSNLSVDNPSGGIPGLLQ